MLLFLTTLKKYAGVAIGALAALFVAYVFGKTEASNKDAVAEKDKEIESTKAVAESQVRAATTAKETVSSVNSSSDSAVDDELQRFTRD